MSEIIKEPSKDISGDSSKSYGGWKDYVEAVENAIEPPPPTIKEKPNEKYAFNVDEALDSIDLTFGGYTPSEDALKFFNIIRLVLGEDPEVDNSLMHYFLVDLLYGNVKREDFPYSKEIKEKIRINPRKIAIIASRFSAKALSLDSKVYTPTGYTTIKDVQVGNEVLDRNGKKCRVIAKSPVFHKDVYKVTLADGRVITMSEDHENIIWKKAKKHYCRWSYNAVTLDPSKYGNDMVEEVIKAKDLYTQYKSTEQKFYVPLLQGDNFEYEYKDFGVDPYTVGVILGNGYIDQERGYPKIIYSKADSYEYIEYIPYEFGKEESQESIGCYVTSLRHLKSTVKKWLSTKDGYIKRVPKELVTGSYHQRLEVLKGLMDSNGEVNKDGTCSFTTSRKELAEDVQDLIRSTGGSAYLVKKKIQNSTSEVWTVVIKTNTKIFKLKRKKKKQHTDIDNTRIPVVSIERVETEPTQCIAVDSPTKSFLTDGYTITHNSTIITAFAPIVTAITGRIPNFGEVSFWVSFGDSQQAGAKVQANTIRDICSDSTFCKEYFERMRFTDEECEFIRKGDGPEKKRAFMFKVKGAAGGSVRGIRYKTERPQIFTFDDIIKNEADANSPIIMNKLRSMIYSDAENALGRKGKIIIVNTPFNKKDPVYTALESGVWTPVCIPICEKIYLDMPKREYRGSWEEMKSYEEVMEKYEDSYYGDTLREFNQELMLRISSEEDKLIKDDQIQWYSRKALEKNLGSYNLYMTTDLTASNNLKGDFSVIMMWAVNSKNDWFLLDLVAKKMTIDEQYRPIFAMNNRWGAKYGRNVTVGIEIDGQQQLNLHTLKKLQIEYNSFFTFAKQIGSPYGKEGISRRQATGAKHEQFMRVHPLFQQHKIYFPEELKDTPDMKEVLNELNYVTYEGFGSKHDDCGTYDTIIDTPTGPKKLGTLQNGDTIIAYGPNGAVEVTVECFRCTGTKLIVNIETASGDILSFSEFHPILLSDGSYKLARDITSGDKLLRNTEWKTQLNTTGLSGQKNQVDIINLQQEYLMDQEKIGYINTYTKNIMALYRKVMTFITKTIIKKIIQLKTWKCCLVKSTKRNIKNKISITDTNLLSTLKNILMKFNPWQKQGKEVSTSEKTKEENKEINHVNAQIVEKSLYHIKMLEKILSSVQPLAQINSTEQRMKTENVKSVEEYLELLAEELLNAKNVDLKQKGLVLTECMNEYAKNAEVYSKALIDNITVEKNAQELLATENKGKGENVVKVWISAPEPTYNFEVAEYHNYQVHNGYVVHNCLDGISMIAAMDVILPSEDAGEPISIMGEDGLIWESDWTDDDEDEYKNNIVF